MTFHQHNADRINNEGAREWLASKRAALRRRTGYYSWQTFNHLINYHWFLLIKKAHMNTSPPPQLQSRSAYGDALVAKINFSCVSIDFVYRASACEHINHDTFMLHAEHQTLHVDLRLISSLCGGGNVGNRFTNLKAQLEFSTYLEVARRTAASVEFIDFLNSSITVRMFITLERKKSRQWREAASFRRINNSINFKFTMKINFQHKATKAIKTLFVIKFFNPLCRNIQHASKRRKEIIKRAFNKASLRRANSSWKVLK